MRKIEVNLEICTLYKGVPYGLAIISYTNNDEPSYSEKENFTTLLLLASGQTALENTLVK